MSRYLVLECDFQEIRAAVGSTGLTGVAVECVLSVPLQLNASEEPWGSETTITALKSLLQDSGFKSGDAIVCVRRNDIELRAISLPDVDADELPDMVRFATPRYFANVTDAWPIDFISMPSHLEGSVDCVVGAIHPALLQKIEQTISRAGLSLKHVFLRPMAAVAGALARHPEWTHETVLFMDLLNEEVEVVISERGNAIFMRNFHAPGEGSDPGAANLFAAEIKRSLLAAASQRPGMKVDRIILWSKDAIASVADALSRSVELPVAMLDPFAWADKANIQIAATTQTVGRFAPVLGAFYFPQQRHRLIDFSNPRRRTEKKKPIARYIAAAVAGIALLAGGWWWYQSTHAALDSEIALLRSSIDNEAATLKNATKHLSDWKKVENFLRGDVPWLEELENLSERAKDADQAYFGTTTFLLEPRSNTASISAKYYTKEQEVVPDVQAAYRDTQHTVKGTAVTQSPDKNYPWASDLTITLAARDVPDPRSIKKAPPPQSQPSPPSDTAPAGSIPETPATHEPVTPAPVTPAPEISEPKTTTSEAVILGDAS
jgi:Tfp pilus assembly PilM family ATPase